MKSQKNIAVLCVLNMLFIGAAYGADKNNGAASSSGVVYSPDSEAKIDIEADLNDAAHSAPLEGMSAKELARHGVDLFWQMKQDEMKWAQEEIVSCCNCSIRRKHIIRGAHGGAIATLLSARFYDCSSWYLISAVALGLGAFNYFYFPNLKAQEAELWEICKCAANKNFKQD